jgi:tetratricopeptide (TPR) repeat protein
MHQHGDAGLASALTQLDQALTVAARAADPDSVADTPGARAGVIRERGLASYEAAQILARQEHLEEALSWLGRAIADLSADDRGIENLASAAYLAADIEGNRLGRPEQARQRLAPVIERCARLDRAEPLGTLSGLSAQLAGQAAGG